MTERTTTIYICDLCKSESMKLDGWVLIADHGDRNFDYEREHWIGPTADICRDCTDTLGLLRLTKRDPERATLALERVKAGDYSGSLDQLLGKP
jgi:hypothetical protein